MDNTKLRDSARGGKRQGLVKGRVYVIASRGACKIGFTSGNPADRLKSLQTGNPNRLELVGSVEGERFLEDLAHMRFESCRLEGEWFRMNPLDALMWLRHEIKDDQRAWTRGELVPDDAIISSSDHGIVAALERHSRSSVWTRDSLDVVTGYPVDDDAVELLVLNGELHRIERRVRGRRFYLYSLEPLNA